MRASALRNRNCGARTATPGPAVWAGSGSCSPPPRVQAILSPTLITSASRARRQASRPCRRRGGAPGRAAGRPAASWSTAADAPALRRRRCRCGCRGRRPCAAAVHVPHRVDRHFCGQVSGVGVPAAGRHQWVDLDQLPTPVQLHQERRRGRRCACREFSWRAVKRLGDLHMASRGATFGCVQTGTSKRRRAPARAAGVRRWRTPRPGAAGWCHGSASRGLGAPGLGARLRRRPGPGSVLRHRNSTVRMVAMRSTRGLSCGVPDPRGSVAKPAGLGVVPEGVIEPRVDRIGGGDDGFHVVRDHHREHPAEERPRCLEPGDHLGQSLASRSARRTCAASTPR